MNQERFIVKFISVKNCFVYIPNIWLQRLSSQHGAIKLCIDNKEYFVSHAKSQSSGNNCLSVSATFGKCLNIKEGDEVFLSWIYDPPVLTSIIVTPVNYSDWEIVRLQADKIQSIMLNQISIVTPNQAIVIWLSKYLNVKLFVDSISPEFLYGKLENYTEVHVQDFPSKKTSSNTIEKILSSINLNQRKNNIDKKNSIISLNIYKQQEFNLIFRICEAPSFEFCCIDESIFKCEFNSPHNIFIRKSELKKLFPNQKTLRNTFGKIRKVLFNDKRNENVNYNLSSNNDNFDTETEDIIVRILSIDDFVDNSIFENQNLGIEKSIWVSKTLRNKLGLQLSSKISVEPLEIIENPVTTIKLIISMDSNSNYSQKLENYIRKYSKNYPILLTSGSMIIFDDGFSCIVKFLPDESTYVLLNESKLEQLKITISYKELKKVSSIALNVSENLEEIIKMEKIYYQIFQEIIDECQMVLSLSFDSNLFSYNRENILICGDTGSGKSTILKILKQKIESFPKNIYTRFINCKKLKGKKSEVVFKLLNSILIECAYYQPSIVFFDDLESIINYSSDADENSVDVINQLKIADVFVKLLTNYQSQNLISAIASCTDMEKLGTKIRSSRGIQLFRTVKKIPSITLPERIKFFKLILKNKLNIDNVNWEKFGEKTENWVAQDLVDLAEKSAFLAWKRSLKTKKLYDKLHLIDEDLILAMETSKPLSLHGVSLYNSDGSSWSDIGGLEDVKNILIQLLKWPLIYPGLFLKAPVKHQSGILLYGMPGTGKTIIAGAIAKECGLNFINIKGPELLSKYIGASEQAVRNIFEKAQMAKPCVLFFDEFDSFAPRRGHDSTGVTDRVVNQLLTQFDGVEGRDGVAIVAATSRPDLLDPALLRPGRLDKSIYCPLPNELEREKILQVLCKSQSLNIEKLNLLEIAKLTNGFTGADLNAILTQARLDSLEKIWSTELSVDEKNFQNFTITQNELINAFELTQPSLTSVDIIKYKQIYKRFVKGENYSDDIRKNQKSTLA